MAQQSQGDSLTESFLRNESKDDIISEEFEELLEQNLKGFGWAMFFQAILIGLPSVFDSMQSFISIYTDAIPTWHCINNGSTTCSSKRFADICKLPNSEWAWDEIPSQTIVSEWGLQCSSVFLRGLPASSHYAGTMLGIFLLASLADSWLGRKKLLLFSCLTMSVTGIITTLSNNIWIYSLLRFVCGFCRATMGTSGSILLSEMVGKQWRGRVGTLPFFFIMVGMLCLPAIAYINRSASWRYIYLYVSVPPLVYCLVLYLFVIESPRWLFVQGRGEEAIKVVKKISPINDETLLMKLESISGCQRIESSSSTVSVFSSLKVISSRKWSCQRILTLMVVAFGTGLVFYGVTLGIGNLNFDIYLSGIFNGLLDIPVVLLTYLLIEKYTRKTSLLILCLASGLFSVMIAVVAEKFKMIQITLSLATFLCGDTALNVLYVYSIEMFPTSVRNFAASLARQAATFGAVISSLLNSLGSKNPYLSYGVFGLIAFCCGFFVLILPETRGISLCDTMDEQEGKENIIHS
ncbi:hypothetical protein Dsin_004251 [Dipteronia sinensis]|uniref:Major facilitator superfamily (MFS) profile domain-containing protein n=1 Tax=Dipteronia sinensis TaxID=43782 RepID=A0AAE0BAN2_9ROSI|nr:hypothetical protein Dsin_004251 [Dipteronia sinensis]